MKIDRHRSQRMEQRTELPSLQETKGKEFSSTTVLEIIDVTLIVGQEVIGPEHKHHLQSVPIDGFQMMQQHSLQLDQNMLLYAVSACLA
jgi:hypothetical protein